MSAHRRTGQTAHSIDFNQSVPNTACCITKRMNCVRQPMSARGVWTEVKERPEVTRDCNSRATASIAFRHLPPNSARTGYVVERALFISVQLSTDTSCQRPPKGIGINKTAEATRRQNTHVNMRRVRPGQNGVLSRFKRFWFYLSWRQQRGRF